MNFALSIELRPADLPGYPEVAAQQLRERRPSGMYQATMPGQAEQRPESAQPAKTRQGDQRAGIGDGRAIHASGVSMSRAASFRRYHRWRQYPGGRYAA